MANTIAATTGFPERKRQSFEGLFSDMWVFKGTISDMAAVAATAIGEFDVTVTGVALGDIVLGVSVDKDLDDGTDQALALQGYVAAANTVTIQLMADDGAYAADDLNTQTIKFLVVRPAW